MSETGPAALEAKLAERQIDHAGAASVSASALFGITRPAKELQRD